MPKTHKHKKKHITKQVKSKKVDKQVNQLRKEMRSRMNQEHTSISRDYAKYLKCLADPGQMASLPYITRDERLDVIPLALSNGFTKNVAINPDSGVDTIIGTDSFLVVFWCPLATALGDETKVSGLTIMNVPASSSTISATGILGIDPNGNLYGSYISQAEAYGSDMSDIGSHGVCWSGTIDMEPVVPQANLAGQYYKGYLTLGQILKEDGSYNVFTLQNLINQSSRIEHSSGEKITLHSHVRNPSLLTFLNRRTTQHRLSGPIMGEVVEYVILQNFARNITTGDNSRYSIIADIQTNWAVWPRVTPASRSLTKSLVTDQKDYIHVPSRKLARLESNIQNPEYTFKETGFSKFFHTGKNIISNIMKFITKHSDVITPLATSAMALLDSDSILVDLNELYFQINLINKFRHTGDSTVDALIDEFESSLNSLKEICRGKKRYVYPPIVWDDPAIFVVPGNPVRTWENMESYSTPSIVPDAINVFRLNSNDPEAVKWYQNFLTVYTSKTPLIKLDDDKQDSLFEKLNILLSQHKSRVLVHDTIDTFAERLEKHISDEDSFKNIRDIPDKDDSVLSEMSRVLDKKYKDLGAQLSPDELAVMSKAYKLTRARDPSNDSQTEGPSTLNK